MRREKGRGQPPNLFIQAFCSLLFLFMLGTSFAREYMTLEEGLRLIYGKGAQWSALHFQLSSNQREELQKRARAAFEEEAGEFYRGEKEGKFLGCTFLMNETGKFRKITFLVALSPKRTVERVLVLVYREPVGSQVHYGRFLNQYRGKKSGDALEAGEDIVGIAGATLSVRAIGRGVRKALALGSLLCGKRD